MDNLTRMTWHVLGIVAVGLIVYLLFDPYARVTAHFDAWAIIYNIRDWLVTPYGS